MSLTNIQWTDNTWNVCTGCSELGPECEHCYSREWAPHLGRMGQPEYEGLTIIGQNGREWTGEIRLLPDRLDQPRRWRKPRMVFVNSMSDTFHPDVPLEFLQSLYKAMEETPWHSNRKGAPLRINNLQKRHIRPLAKLVGLPTLTLKQFRANVSTLLQEGGAPVKVAQQQLGHADAQTTLKHYSAVVDESHRSAIEKLEQRLCPSVPKCAQVGE